MTVYIALLRGINVGGNTLLPMSELRSICEGAGLKNVLTYIQSGNIVFRSDLSEKALMKVIEEALLAKKQRQIPVMIRSSNELKSIASRNPFPDAKPSQVGILFLVNRAPDNLFDNVTIAGPEKVVVSGREIYIHYPDGMGRSKLKFPKMPEAGTMRNLNTLSKLIELSGKIAE